ncbi:D-alanyl-D-alanine carboxypeptidase family protein [Marinobacterium aestuariivivens]|uniref:D-alanyl-D-alanine carboxypeptidase family protein n=1 Tax=Marinobacterium aestuariivivens TaxID=1698799 RepID=A0ABW2A6G8_9GAMM
MLATPVSSPRFAGSAVLVLTLLFASAVATAADELSPRLLLDAGSGRVLQQQATGRLWYPASLTKLMTLYLAFEALADGRLSLDQSLPVSQRAAAQPAVKLGLRAGASLSVEQAIQALATISSNDVAVVLAEALAGSEAAFADQMTQRAASFGMLDTRFRNASGLPDPGQVTTARDMAILAQRLYRDFPQRMALFSARSFAFNGHRHGSHNPLLGGYPGADGLKTGFTCDSGYNMVATATRDDRRLVAVVLGAASRASRDRQVRALLDSGFAVADALEALPALSDLPARISRACRPRDCCRGSVPPVWHRKAARSGRSKAGACCWVSIPARPMRAGRRAGRSPSWAACRRGGYCCSSGRWKGGHPGRYC